VGVAWVMTVWNCSCVRVRSSSPTVMEIPWSASLLAASSSIPPCRERTRGGLAAAELPDRAAAYPSIGVVHGAEGERGEDVLVFYPAVGRR